MRKIISVILPIVFSSIIFGQIPNASFENWTNGQPDGWVTSNAPTIYTNVTRVTNSYSGNYALKGEVITSAQGNINPFVFSGVNGKGFSINKRYATVSGYYQFVADSGDRFTANIVMTKNGSPVAVNVTNLDPTSSYKLFNLNMAYQSSEVPDTCIIQFIIIGPTSGIDYHAGSYFILDNLSISGTATDVKSSNSFPKTYELYQNYPNPFNPSTTIEYAIPTAGDVQLKIYDLLGRELLTLVDKYEPAGIYQINFNSANLSSGVYFYKIHVNNFVAMKKLILLK